MTKIDLRNIKFQKKATNKVIVSRGLSKLDVNYLDKFKAIFESPEWGEFGFSNLDYDPAILSSGLSHENLKSSYLQELVRFRDPAVVKPVFPEPDGYAEYVLREFALNKRRMMAHDAFDITKRELKKYLTQYRSYKSRQKSNFSRYLISLCLKLKIFPSEPNDYPYGLVQFKIHSRLDVAMAVVWILRGRKSPVYDNWRPIPRSMDKVKAQLDQYHRTTPGYAESRGRLTVRIPSGAAESIEAKRQAFFAKSNLPPSIEPKEWQRYLVEICDFDKEKNMEMLRNVFSDKKNWRKNLARIKQEAKRYFASSQNQQRRAKDGARFSIKVPVNIEPANPTTPFKR